MRQPELLRSLREEASLNQEDLALVLGVTVATIGNWEQGRAAPSKEATRALAQFYSQPIAVIRGEENPRALSSNERLALEQRQELLVREARERGHRPDGRRRP